MERSTWVKPPDGRGSKIELVDIYKVTINPRLDIIDLLELIAEEEDKGNLELLSIGYDARDYIGDKSRKVDFGKDGLISIRTSDMFLGVPLKTLKLGDKYITHDVIEGFRELEGFLVKNYSTYNIGNIYPTSLTILDKCENRQPIIIKFDKRRKLDPESELRQDLRGGQSMPLDAVDLYYVKLDKRTLVYKRDKKPKRIAESEASYEKNKYIINADDIALFTEHIYPHMEELDGNICQFTVVTTCLVGKQEIPMTRFVPIDGGTCREIPCLSLDKKAEEDNN